MALIFGNILNTVSCTIPDAVLALLIPNNFPITLSIVQYMDQKFYAQ